MACAAARLPEHLDVWLRHLTLRLGWCSKSATPPINLNSGNGIALFPLCWRASCILTG